MAKKDENNHNETDSDSSNHNTDETMLPSIINILPLSERPFFPPQTLPILMNEEIWESSLMQISDTEHKLAGLLLTNSLNTDKADIQDFESIGTLVRVHHPVNASGKIQFIAEGVHRFRIKKWLKGDIPFMAEVEYPQEPDYRNQDRIRAYAINIINNLKELSRLHPLYGDEVKFFLNRFDLNDPSTIADFSAGLTTANKHELQKILDTVDLKTRLEKVLTLVRKELEVSKIQNTIHQQVENAINEGQRKFFLREQLKVIQKELGLEMDDRTADIKEFSQRISQKQMPDNVVEKLFKEINKLKILEAGSPEYAVTRNYLEATTELPWGLTTKDNLNLNTARRILSQSHAGLDDVKQRIIEFLAVGALKGEITGAILLLVGPPGVGKTSIGMTIAKALKRNFFRFSVGGLHDEAEIKGHRKTYIGAMPGKIVQALRQTNSANPVIMLDEIDKIGNSYQGDPASALLEVLDPEQNGAFLDNYIDLRIDLSKVLFICTANQLDSIPSPLLDRMEIIRLAGYLIEEKIEIVEKYLWPKKLNQSGLSPSQLKITPSALKFLIEGYARGAGLRSLEKQLGRIVRKSVVRIVSNAKFSAKNIHKKSIVELLGEPYFQDSKPNKSIGVVTGLAWTAMGGCTLDIEAAIIHHKHRGLKLTGNLGEVMRESAEIAYSYISSHAKALQLNEDIDNAFIHIHVPEGATPKDGPSAGITIATAILSLLLKKIIKRPLAMTGELTLTGLVYAVGGIQEKIIAAKRAKIKEIILPQGVIHQFQQLPSAVREGMNVHFVKDFMEVVGIAFPKI